MVRLHIKLNHECRNVVANILPPDPSNHKQTLGVGSNYLNQLFQNMVMLHIKLNHECRNVVANILPPDPSNHKQTLRVGSNVKINVFSKHGHVAYQIKWNHECSHMVANIFPADPCPSPALGVKRLKYKFFRT